MCAEISKQYTQNKGNPFILGTSTKSTSYISVYIRIGVCIVNHHIRLLAPLDFFHLATTERTDYRCLRNLTSAMLTELCFLNNLLC